MFLDAFEIFDRARKREISFTDGEGLLTIMYRNSGNASRAFIRNLFDKVNVKSEAKDLFLFKDEGI